MATSEMSKVVQHLRTMAMRWEAVELTDGQLLDCFVKRREQAALEVLVRRHGPMVWSVCRRILLNHHDAEDAFQATFLVLIRKAASILPREMVGNWLYGVAQQTARKAKTTTDKRRTRERQQTQMPETGVTDKELWTDLQPLLDQELNLLPDKYRVVMVLCDLEGKTRPEAARQLGLPEGTVASRLARARTMLAKRLARHGLSISGGMLATVLSQHAVAALVPNSVMADTIKAVTSVAAGHTLAGVISVKVATLTEGVLKTMFLTKIKTASTVLLVIALAAVGAGGLFYSAMARETTIPQAEGEKERKRAKEAADKADADQAAQKAADAKDEVEKALRWLRLREHEIRAAVVKVEEAKRRVQEAAKNLDEAKAKYEQAKEQLEKLNKQKSGESVVFLSRITKIETKDGKTTFTGTTGKLRIEFVYGRTNISGSGEGKEFSLSVSKDVKVAMARFSNDFEKFEAGDAIEGGLKNKVFTNVNSVFPVWVYLTTQKDIVTQILVVPMPGRPPLSR